MVIPTNQWSKGDHEQGLAHQMPAEGRGQLLQGTVLRDGQGEVAQRRSPEEAADGEPDHQRGPLRLLSHN